ncbi:MAG: class I SAM-dependent methyltransferase, partial [Polyangiaceae bacterium]|nr:class I SAM-dependent methyltransferase [Polyangiaceae bacterium]
MKWGKITILVVLLLSGVAGSANACDMNELKLPASLASSLAAGHPWVYRDHVGQFRARSGDWVKFHAGSLQGWGLWDEEGSIALRVYSLVQRPNENWVRERVREAWNLREETRRRGVSGYRLIFGEADAFPGLVVDLYAGYAILVAYSKSVGSVIPWLSTALMELSEIKGVMRRRKVEQQVTLSVLAGEQAPEEVVIREGRMKLLAELTRGQKTGLFFDHRENRAHVGARAANRDVLNLFSYTGGFSVAAALGGAKSVTSVDLAQPAIDACTRNFELNELSGFEHQGIAADV